MFCQECGTEFNGKFCPNCGAPAAKTAGSEPSAGASEVSPGFAEEAVSTEKKSGSGKKKKKGRPGVPLFAVILVALVVSCGALFGNGSSSNGSSSGGSKSETVQTGNAGSQAFGQSEGNGAGSGTGNGSEAEKTGSEGAEDGQPALEQPVAKQPGTEAAGAEGGNVSAENPAQSAASSKVVDYVVKQEYFYDYVTSLGSHTASAFVEIENTGTTALYLHDGVFDIEDSTGHLLKSDSLISTCPDAILPGETGYFYEDYIDLDNVDTSNGLVFAPHYKVEEARHEIIDYQVTDLDIREDDFFHCKVSGRLTNTTNEEIGLLYVNVVYYDAAGNTIGISGTNLTDIQPGETESFEITGRFFREDVSLADISRYLVIPRAWYMQF